MPAAACRMPFIATAYRYPQALALLLCFRVEEVDFFRSVLVIGMLAF